MPVIRQALFHVPAGIDAGVAERRCYLARKRAERRCRDEHVSAYFASWSTRTVTYKAMSAADQLSEFYPDLNEHRWHAWFAIFHQRYSTNTLPAWERAQPFRYLCHNGEINTIEGNVNLMGARVGQLGIDWPELDEGESLLQPLIEAGASDSAQLDNVFELLLRGERSGPHAMAMLVPQVWEGARDLEPAVRDFYRYHAGLVEPWDGPAGLVFTDGLRCARRSTATGCGPCAPASARTASWSWPPRSAPCARSATARSPGDAWAQARCWSSTRSSACSPTTRSSAASPPASLTASG